MKFKSLKTKILVWFGAVTFVLLFIFSIAFYYFFNKSINASMEVKLYTKATIVKNKLSSSISINKIVQKIFIAPFDLAIMKKGKIINKTKNFNLKVINSKKSFFTIDYGENISAIYVLDFDKPFAGKIILLERNIDDKAEDLVDTMLWLDPILLILLMLVGSRLIDKILIPIKTITKIANEITINNLLLTIYEPKENDEIRDLVKSFNAMVKRLKVDIEKIERFNDDVSHELKTPLTVIKGEAELTLDRLRKPKDYIKSMKIIEKEASKIQKIVDGLLLVSRYSKANIQNSFKICFIDDILLKAIQLHNGLTKEKNISLKIQRIEPISTKANPILIETIFSNLIDNAIKYTNKDKNIHISLFKNNKIHFIIKDEGIGIEKEKLPFVTDRFYRVDNSRNKKTGGFGLGLSIVKNSVELHGGKLMIESKEGEGTKIEVFL